MILEQQISRTSQFLLPFHLGKHVLVLLKEARHFATLLVTFEGRVDALFRLLGQVLADLRDREDDLLHRPVVSHNLNRSRLLLPLSSMMTSLAIGFSISFDDYQSKCSFGAYTLFVRYSRTNKRKNMLSIRVVPVWNGLPNY